MNNAAFDVNLLLTAEEDVSYTEEDAGATALPPLPEGLPPPVPPPEPKQRRCKAELTSDFFDLLSEQGVRDCHCIMLLG